MSGRRTFIILLVFSLIILSACSGQGSTPVPPAPSLATIIPTSHPQAAIQASPTLLPPTAAPTLAPTATLTPNPNAGKNVTIQTIKMLDPQHGWALGPIAGKSSDSILFTLDGGLTWKEVSPAQTSGPTGSTNLRAQAFFLNASQAWVIYNHQDPQSGSGPVTVWHTADGGQIWKPSQDIALDNSVQMDFFSPSQLGFSDPLNGWLLVHLGAGMSHDYVAVFTSRDGGQTWQAVVDPNLDNLNMSCDKSGVTFLNSASAWAAGNCQGVAPILYLYRSGDAGHTWEQVGLPSPAGTTNLFQSDTAACGATPTVFISDQDGNFVVQCYNAQNSQTNQWLYSTHDRGQNWSSQPLPAPFGSVDFIDPSTAWMVGSISSDDVKGSKVYFTHDGGQNWTALSIVNWSGTPDFVDPQTGWVIATSGNNSSGNLASVLVKSTNGGKSWKELKPKIAP